MSTDIEILSLKAHEMTKIPRGNFDQKLNRDLI